MQLKKLSCITLLASSLVVAESTEHSTSLADLLFYRDDNLILLPYGFSSESMGRVGGAGAIIQGVLQPQTTLVLSAFVSLKEDVVVNGEEKSEYTRGGFYLLDNFGVPGSDRLFFSSYGFLTKMPRQNFYFDSSHDSNDKDLLVSPATNNMITGMLSYVLPWGEGIDNPEGVYEIEEGFAVKRENAGGGLPFVTGRTSIGFTLFYQHQSIDSFFDALGAGIDAPAEWNSNGLRLFLSHDNTDYEDNPSRGYSFFLQYSRDFGKFDSLQSWDFLEFKASNYVDLDTFSFTRQNVLALNFWTAYSFSWENDSELRPGIDAHRPPMWDGPRLGGFMRMRGYDSDRFADKAAIYGTAEYRMILDYNPIKDGTFGELAAENIPLDWFQVVGFVEAGRVHDRYNTELLSDMKVDVGISLRSMVAEIPVRVDVAYGNEGVEAWLMVHHPFDF
ncbi:BamA/TamA family outer membrane protein [Sulfurovum mangrovi]|uniref:hypothetical protein n=1 Tax=Sulfurovum mangrovi TaxID=2893889 RepID=UPI001E4EF6A9|nr:hypothetical protein [Sulfurovum mangrovi]UFH58101.1 hypothetical protein LN246_07025 [Sulfurovum mangrovi]